MSVVWFVTRRVDCKIMDERLDVCFARSGTRLEDRFELSISLLMF